MKSDDGRSNKISDGRPLSKTRAKRRRRRPWEKTKINEGRVRQGLLLMGGNGRWAAESSRPWDLVVDSKILYGTP